MKRNASAKWLGGLKDGKGFITTETSVLKDVPYSFGSRFENEQNTNPEELLAAAHAGCFTMALSAELGKIGIVPKELKTTATVFLDAVEGGFAITKIHLEVTAHVPGIDESKFGSIVKIVEKNCPVSKLFKAEITTAYRLVV